jgi:GNAT superfamily N-acetyltransferase
VSELSRDDIAALERIEVETCRLCTEAAPDAVARGLGIGLRPLRSGLAVKASGVDIMMYNRVVGFGVETPANAADLDDAVAWYRAAGVPRMMLNLAPVAAPDPRGWLEERGFNLHNHWMRLWRDARVPVDAPEDPRVRPIGREHAEIFSRTDVEAFGHPEALIPWLAATVGLPGWRHWAAFDGDVPAGFGALYVRGDLGWLGFGSTRATHRKQGMQSAIIAARIRAAASLGCRLLSVETADDTPEKPNPSTHNLVRMGFRLAYRRPNWVLKLA